MARGKRSDPSKVTEGVRIARATGDVTAAAEAVGVSRSTLYAAMKEERGKPQAIRTRRRSTAVAQSDLSEPSELSASLDASLDGLSGSAADFAELDAIVVHLRGRLEACPTNSPRLTGIVTALVGAISKRARLRPPPPPDPTDALREARLRDGRTRRKLLMYIERYEQQAARSGECLHCGSKLSDKQLADLYG